MRERGREATKQDRATHARGQNLFGAGAPREEKKTEGEDEGRKEDEVDEAGGKVRRERGRALKSADG